MAAHYYSISPGYLRAAATGCSRAATSPGQDDATKPNVALVNETFARKHVRQHARSWPAFPLPDKSLYEIVGVVEDGKYDSLTEDPTPAMFLPLAQNNQGDTAVRGSVAVAAGRDGAALNRVLSER